jgi:acyl-lipid omega-6 desaturase (Delta-12 desaturase)
MQNQTAVSPDRQALASYAQPRLGRSVLDVLTSIVPYLALSTVIYLTLGDSLVLTVVLVLFTAGFLVRTFIVFHDCGHGSFLPSKRANRYLGRFAAFLVLTPFERWRQEHAVHHATAGDLERRGVGDVPTLTVAEYEAKSWSGRLGYRLFRNPAIMFGIGPIFAMMIGPRLTIGAKRARLRNSVLLTNAALFVVVGGLVLLIGWQDFLLTWGPAAMVAGSAGIWLFYVQHQFEDVYWQSPDSWSYEEAALQGSSYLKLPKVLQFFSGNIGLHHVHHLNAKIPNYNLQAAHDENAVFADVPVLTVGHALMCCRLKLYDERSGKLVTFAQARATSRASQLAATVLSTAVPAKKAPSRA